MRLNSFTDSTTTLYRPTPTPPKNLSKPKLKTLVYQVTKNFSPPNFLLTHEDFNNLKSLRDDKDIVLIKPDKGNGVVILNRKSDDSKFRPLSSDPIKATLQKENRLRNLLKKLKKDNVIDQKTYDKLALLGTRPETLYGLPKVHKANVPLRPILSAFHTSSYNLSKYLLSFMNDISIAPYTISDTPSFVNELRSLNFNSSDIYMASFDVTSLFTNVPIDETIDIIINKKFSSSSLVSSFSFTQFRNLLSFVVKNCHFLFSSCLLEQVDGVAMGSPLEVSAFANFFLCFHENQWLDKCPCNFQPFFKPCSFLFP